jgi:hypothetical protein
MGSFSLDNLVIDNIEDGLFRVNRQAFTEPDILVLEHAWVFERCWIYAGHASEIPQLGAASGQFSHLPGTRWIRYPGRCRNAGELPARFRQLRGAVV